jgi:uncharacterized protein YycO
VSILSRLIKWRTWSDYSHAAVELNDRSVIDAWKGGVRHVRGPLEGHDPGTVVEAYQFDASPIQVELIESFAKRQVGIPYDYLGVLRFLTRRKVENRKWFCSELVFAAMVRAGLQPLARILPCQVSPGDLSHSPLLIPDGVVERTERSTR